VSKIAAQLHVDPRMQRPTAARSRELQELDRVDGRTASELARTGDAVEGERDSAYSAHSSDAVRYRVCHLRKDELDGIAWAYAGGGVGMVDRWVRV
jgi:hypothetical protein